MAQFLSDNKQLIAEFQRLCTTYKHYMWATAWAGDADSVVGKLLRKHVARIEKLVVGLHFYQTSPNFIDEFMSFPSVRFYPQTDETFHPKVYLFYDDSEHWEALVGSSNFTRHGFSKNIEANVLLSQADGGDIFKQIKNFVESIWTKAEHYDKDLLAIYKTNQKVQQRHIDRLKKSRLKEKITDFDLMSWEEFEEKISNDKRLNNRIELLRVAHEIFKKHPQFNTIELAKRKNLAGFVETMPGHEDIDWRLFGSTKPCRNFKPAVNEENIYLAKAIDSIPLEGEIKEHHVKNYIKLFRKAIPMNRKNPLTSATRLLAIKRPDVFVCVDERNKRGICKEYNIPLSHMTLDNYWPLLIRRIQSDEWFEGEKKSKYYKYRVALLDCLHYENE